MHRRVRFRIWGLGVYTVRGYSPPEVDTILSIWGSDNYGLENFRFYLLKGDSKTEACTAQANTPRAQGELAQPLAE